MTTTPSGWWIDLAFPTKMCSACGATRPQNKKHFKVLVARGQFSAECRTCLNGRNKDRREMLRTRVKEYLTQHPCVDCGETDVRVLTFDHRDPTNKVATVATMVSRGAPWSRIKKEIAKCDVRCANDHFRKTSEQFGTLLYIREDWKE
jgi:hypothetical protein